jgi:hypothetical protein
MGVLIARTKLRCQSGNFSESERSEYEHEIGDKNSSEESQWLINYLKNSEGNLEVDVEHTIVDIEEEATSSQNNNGVISLLLPLRVKSRNKS